MSNIAQISTKTRETQSYLFEMNQYSLYYIFTKRPPQLLLLFYRTVDRIIEYKGRFVVYGSHYQSAAGTNRREGSITHRCKYVQYFAQSARGPGQKLDQTDMDKLRALMEEPLRSVVGTLPTLNGIRQRTVRAFAEIAVQEDLADGS